MVGVIGHPVRHSLSPLLHNTAFAALGLNWVSVAFEVAPGQAAAALDGMRALGVAGLSVTMPHKADVAALVDECSAVAAAAGGGQLRRQPGRRAVRGQHRRRRVPGLAGPGGRLRPAGKRCLIIGAGGAARAVTLALADAGAADRWRW